MLTKMNKVVWINSLRPLIFFPFFLFFVACTSTPTPNTHLYECNQVSHIRQGMDFFPQKLEWEQIATGIQYTQYQSQKAPLLWHLVSVDLHNPQLEILSYPSPQEINKKGEFTGKNTWQFLDDTNAVLAVNATPFTAPHTQFLPQRKLIGLYIADGEILSPPVSRYSAICFSKQNGLIKATILQNQATYPTTTDFAFGGFFAILQEGEIQDFPACSLDARLALGVSQDKQYLFILYVEAENKKESLGLSYEESAHIMKSLGVWNAIQMDGGGSASLSIQGKTITTRNHRLGANLLGFTLSPTKYRLTNQ